MPENFADYPKTIGEIRSDKSGFANEWTPRDALLALLRDIDAGKAAPEQLVMVWVQDDQVRYSMAVNDALTAMGLLEGAKILMTRRG